MSNKLADLLAGTVPSGVYRLASSASAAALAAGAGEAGWTFFQLEGGEITSKTAFLGACAAAMGFPDYFGANWDALEDNLRDLSWAPAKAGYLVLYDGAGVFAAAAPADFRVALAILRSAAAFWARTATPMIVLLRGLGRRGPHIHRLVG
jgi:hypothetical protein